MVRAVFFVAASTYASPATILPSVTRTGAGVPVLLLGGLGVIHRPLTGGDRFRHVDEVVDLFAQLDTDDSLVEFEDVWLPVAWLADQNPPERSHPHFHHFAGRGPRGSASTGIGSSRYRRCCWRAARTLTIPQWQPTPSDGHGHMANRTDPTLVAEKVRGFLAATAS